ncbi:TPA: hypothetical protein DCX16_05930 [bacterium]|nr:hypothetical protein [bacterium]
MIEKIAKILEERDNFLITSHIHPDGDSIGCQIALYLFLSQRGKRVVIINEESPPENMLFLPYLDKIFSPKKEIKSDITIVLDTNDITRLGKKMVPFVKRIPFVINIDHHLGGGIGNLNWIDEKASSVCEMIHRLIKTMGGKQSAISKEIAILLYVGIATDTGFFSFANTSPKCMEVAGSLLEYEIFPDKIKEFLYNTKSLNEIKFFGRHLSDIEEDGPIVWTKITKEAIDELGKEPETDTILDTMRWIKNAYIMVLFRELAKERTKVSLRSKRGLDVRSIAEEFGGGGHLQASGCIIPVSLEVAERHVLSAIKNYLTEKGKLWYK